MVLGHVGIPRLSGVLTRSPGNPLGREFTLSPTDQNGNYFLSYSIEPACRRLPYTAHAARAAPPQVYLLAKQAHYLSEHTQTEPAPGAFSWALNDFTRMQRALGVRVVAGFDTHHDQDTPARVQAVADAGIYNFGKLDKMDFYANLGNSHVLVGVGRPRISPSPYDALCLGVPVRRATPRPRARPQR